ncbi:hypothetical protein ACP4OV_004340 [Aristida adscensionis]
MASQERPTNRSSSHTRGEMSSSPGRAAEPAGGEADDLLTNPAWWAPDDPTVLHDPRFRFPAEELLARARASCLSGSGVPRERRRDMDDEALARVFGLDGVGVRGHGGSSPATGGGGGGGEGDGDGKNAVLGQEPGCYDVVAACAAEESARGPPAEAADEYDGVLDAGWDDLVRAIDELLMDDEYEEDDVEAAAAAVQEEARPEGLAVDGFDDGVQAIADVKMDALQEEGGGGGLAPQQPGARRGRKVRRYVASKKTSAQ